MGELRASVAAPMGVVNVRLVDCHCHLSSLDFDGNLDYVLEKARKANVMALVVVAEHSREFEKIMLEIIDSNFKIQ